MWAKDVFFGRGVNICLAVFENLPDPVEVNEQFVLFCFVFTGVAAWTGTMKSRLWLEVVQGEAARAGHSVCGSKF